MSTTKTAAPVPAAVRAVRRHRRAGGQVFTLRIETSDSVDAVAAPCGGTAAWSYTPSGHRIALDPEFFSQSYCVPKVKAGKRIAARYASALLRHERGHGLFTERDLPRFDAWCRREGIAFGLLNLFEDLRIEHLLRGKDREVFRWADYNALPTMPSGGHTDPLAWLSAVIFSELAGDIARLGASLTGYLDRYLPSYLKLAERDCERVRGGVKGATEKLSAVLGVFVREIATAKATGDLLPLMRDWVDTFPAESKATESKDGKADPSQSTHGDPRVRGVGGGIALTDKHWTPLVETEYPDEPPAVDVSNLSPSTLTSLAPFLMGGLDALEDHDDSQYTDTSAAPAIASRLGSLLGQVNPTAMRTASSGNRLHMSGAMVGESQSFRQRTGKTGVPNMVLVVDQSGSMNGQWREHGAAFVAAAMALHQQGRMQVQVILTGDSQYAVLPPNTPSKVVDRLACMGGSESVDRTLRANEAALRAADIVVVYTDGNLTDDVVDAASWRNKGVNLVGACTTTPMYAGSVERAMRGHFGQVVIAQTGAELATKLVQVAARSTRR